MIFNEKLLFLHYPKTGGMMLTPQFLANLKGQVHYSVPKGHISPEERIICLRRSVKILDGLRHENIRQAKEKLNNFPGFTKFDAFEKVVVIIRNPYDYIVSRFHYLQNNQGVNIGPAARIAAEGNFRKYAIEAPRFFKVDGYLLDDNKVMPDNLFVIRFEDFSTQINLIMKDSLKKPINFEKRLNSSKRKKYQEYITDAEIENAIYLKFKLLFDKGYYSRLTF